MERIGSIICELNPFTMGHQYIVEQARRMGVSHLIAVMSGDFVQRGEPAFISTQSRAKIALGCGFDLVLEIPSVWSMSAAETYAKSGVFMANALGCVDSLIFGSECENLDKLDKISEIELSSLFVSNIKSRLDSGETFAKIRERTIEGILGTDYSYLLKSPNNILAIEYLKTLKRFNSRITPIAVKRVRVLHDSAEPLGNFASSSLIRQLIAENSSSWESLVPPNCADVVKGLLDAGGAPVTAKRLERAMLYKLSCMEEAEFKILPDISEGLENRIFRCAQNATSLEELISAIKTKRYTWARIKRIVMSAFLGINAEAQECPIPYIKVLGANHRGLEILKRAKDCAILPIISRSSDLKQISLHAKEVLKNERRINRIYSLMSPKITKTPKLNFIFREG